METEIAQHIGKHFMALIFTEAGVWRAQGRASIESPDWGYSMAGNTPLEALQELEKVIFNTEPLK